jgi:hypothetical protein
MDSALIHKPKANPEKITISKNNGIKIIFPDGVNPNTSSSMNKHRSEIPNSTKPTMAFDTGKIILGKYIFLIISLEFNLNNS